MYWVYTAEVPQEKAQQVKAEILTKNTQKGQRANFSLKDGSKIKLNADSRLLIPESFTDSTRVVELTSGEAYFEVAPDEDRPFIVKTNELAVAVLGTAFNVHSYTSDNIVSIAVTEGKVAVGKPHKPATFYLTPGEACYFNKQTGELKKSTFDNEKLLAWKDGILIFEDADVNDILKELERWYGVEFTIEGSVSTKRKFNGRFKNASLETVLEAFSFSSWFDYELNGKQVHLKMQSL